MNNRKKQRKAIKYELDTMVEFDNHLKKNIDLSVDNTQLKGVKQGTPGFSNRTTLVVLQYIFNIFGQVNLVDKDHNNEIMRKSYKPITPIDWIFDQIDEGKYYSIAANEPYSYIKMVSLGLFCL